MAPHVIPESGAEALREADDTASVRVTFGPAGGGPPLEQRVARFAPGRSSPRAVGPGEEVLFVVAGTGTLALNGDEYPLEPETAVCVPPGRRWEVEVPGPDELVLVSVAGPPLDGIPGAAGASVVRLRERPIEPAGRDREFRYGADARAITQFVGVIPPGRAKPHYHEYEELAYVLEGEGMLHMAGERSRVVAGSCIHFPPRVPHILENVGAGPLRVLGVFHPAGDPSMAYNVPDLEGEVT